MQKTDEYFFCSRLSREGASQISIFLHILLWFFWVYFLADWNIFVFFQTGDKESEKSSQIHPTNDYISFRNSDQLETKLNDGSETKDNVIKTNESESPEPGALNESGRSISKEGLIYVTVDFNPVTSDTNVKDITKDQKGSEVKDELCDYAIIDSEATRMREEECLGERDGFAWWTLSNVLSKSIKLI